MTRLKLVSNHPAEHLCSALKRKLELDTGVEVNKSEGITLEVSYGFFVGDEWYGWFSTECRFCPFCGEAL